MYVAGSDDFRGYVWKIPPLSVLEEQRKVLSINEWENCRSATTEVGELSRLSIGRQNAKLFFVQAFTNSIQDTKYLPKEISTPLCRLSGKNKLPFFLL